MMAKQRTFLKTEDITPNSGPRYNLGLPVLERWQGRMGNAANPPTQLDHRWNPNATKIVIPISDEGPYGGDPAQASDDIQSINEAHDAV